MAFFMMVLFITTLVFLCIVGGSVAVLLPYIRRHWRRLEGGESVPDVARLQESIDDLTAQVNRLEEEKDFYSELRSPQDTPQIESEEGPDSNGSR